MAEYIDKEAFVAEKRKFFCEDCSRRKSMKDKSKFVYDIGDAPCRACDIDDMIDAVEDFPAADVVEVVRCKDCKHSDTFPADGEVPEMPLKCLGIRYGGVMGDWYCEHGERRADNG